MTQDFKDMIDRLATARNHNGGNFILATAMSGDEDIKIEYKAIAEFKISVIRTLIDDVLNGTESDMKFNFTKNMILDKIREAEVQRFQQCEIGAAE